MSGAGARISHDQWTWLQSLNSNIDLATTDTNTHIGVYKIFWRLEIKSLLISLTTLWCLLEINIHWIKDTVCFHMIVGYDENTPLMIHTRFINNHGVFHVIIIRVWFLNCHSTSTLNHRYAQPLILENIFLKHNSDFCLTNCINCGKKLDRSRHLLPSQLASSLHDTLLGQKVRNYVFVNWALIWSDTHPEAEIILCQSEFIGMNFSHSTFCSRDLMSMSCQTQHIKYLLPSLCGYDEHYQRRHWLIIL